MAEIKNATIKSTTLGTESHGILSAYIHLDYGGGGQAFGGYGFDEPVHVDGKFSHRRGHAYGMEFVRRVLKTVGVDSWEKLPGTPVRVRAEHSKVHAIGHYLREDWFYPDALAKEMRMAAHD